MSDTALQQSIATVATGRWGVGVSGGADSVALLHLLHIRRPADIHVIHLDHETRDGESARDADFVAALAAELGLPVTIGRRSTIEQADVTPLANPSARFRKARFALFRQVVAEESLQGVILAHHADDQAETILHRLLRGGGPASISGMRPCAGVDGLTIVRPLLGIPSFHLRRFLIDHKYAWREDSSNSSDKYERNRLRRWLADHPSMQGLLLSLGEQSRKLRDWLDQQSPDFGDAIPIKALAHLPGAVAGHAVSRWLVARGSPKDQINRRVCDRFVEMANDAASPARQHFPGGLLIRRSGGSLKFQPESNHIKNRRPAVAIPVTLFAVVPDHTQRFTDRVDFYVRSRPTYPAALLRFFQSDLALSPIDPVADIGSGTGFLTELFVRNGNPTFAVEPNDPMRAAAEAHLGEWSNFHSIKGTAEATTLAPASAKFVVAGQAFHWFDPDRSRVEFQRVLVPDGVVALVWNDRMHDQTPFNQAYETLMQRHQIEKKMQSERSLASLDDARFLKFFGPGGYQIRSFENPQTLDRQGLIDRLSSASYMPLPDHPLHSAMHKELGELYEAHQQHGFVRIPLITKVYFGRIT